MKFGIWLDLDGEAVTQQDLQPGDVFVAKLDSWEPGEQEKKRMLIVQIDGVTQSQAEEIVEPGWANAPGPIPRMEKQRRYRVAYEAKLTPEQLADVNNPDVAVEPVVGVFSAKDILPKW